MDCLHVHRVNFTESQELHEPYEEDVEEEYSKDVEVLTDQGEALFVQKIEKPKD